MTKHTREFSFSRALRLQGARGFAAVFAFRCWVRGELFSVYARPNGSSAPRFGVVVSKRVISGAVARNYCKRLAREVFRVERGTLSGMDIVVRPRARVTAAMSALARTEMRDLLQRAQRQCARHKMTGPRQNGS